MFSARILVTQFFSAIIIFLFLFLFSGYVGPEVEITNGCFIGAACRLTLPEKLPENISVCGTNHLRKIMSDKPLVSTESFSFPPQE